MKEMSSYTRGTISKFYNLIDKLLKLPIETYVKPWYLLLLPRRQKELSCLSFLSLLSWILKKILLDWQIVCKQ